MKKHALEIAVLVILTAVIIYFTPSQSNKSEPISHTSGELDTITETETLYGIPIDSFTIVFDTIKTGNTLSDILIPYYVSPVIVDKIGRTACDSFPVDEIRAGRPYKLFCYQLDTSNQMHAQLMVYENNGIDYTIYDFRDSLTITKGQKPVILKKKIVCGSIESSLWNALKAKNANPLLALEMAELYSWSIDFFALKKADEFKIIYEVAEVEGIEQSIEDITAGYMKPAGEEFWAIPFVVNDTLDFYDEKGGSLKKAFLKAPLRFNRISSRFTNSRMHPILHYRRPHRAVDYSAPTGTPIRTIGDGTVILRKYGSGAGNYIKIKHNSVYTSVYMHMSKFGVYKLGDRVKQGDVIGYVGSTGLSTGPHLHFEVHKNGVQIDPLKLESPPSKPVPDSLMDDYSVVFEEWKDKIINMDCSENVKYLEEDKEMIKFNDFFKDIFADKKEERID